MTYFDTDLVRQFGLFSKVKKIYLVRHPPPAAGRRGGGLSPWDGKRRIWPPKAATIFIVVTDRIDIYNTDFDFDFETDSDSDEQFSEDKDGL